MEERKEIEHEWKVEYLMLINNETIVCQKKETAKLIAESLQKNTNEIIYILKSVR